MTGSLPTSDNLTKDEEKQALERIQALKVQQEAVKKGAVTKYVNSVKQSMLFRPGYNWSEMLSAAPTSVYLLGSLFIASTVPDAQDIKIIPPTDGFKTLRTSENPSLSSCLVQCSDKGNKSFTIAVMSMDAIALKSNSIKDTVADIIHLLGSPEEAEISLAITIKQLASLAKSCEKDAQKVAQTFEEWLDMVCEIHACVAQTSSDTSEKRVANANHLAAAQTRLVGQEKVRDEAEKDLNNLRDCMKSAMDKYNKAADEFPSGWELIAQEFLSNLSDTFTMGLNQAVPALIEHFSTTAKIEKGMQIFTGDRGSAKGGSAGDGGKVDHSDAPRVTSVPNPTPTAVLPYAKDPAYAVIGPILTLVTAVQSFLTGGENHGIDWKLLESKDPAKRNNGLGVISLLLEDAKKNFKPSADPPSNTLTTILTDVLKITAELQKALEKGKAIGGKYPAADSSEVAQWQKSIIEANARAVQLNTEAKNVTNAYSAPMITKPDAGVNPQDKKGALRKQIIDAATTKLTTTAEVLQTTSTNFQKSSEKVIEIQQSIVAIQAELAELKAANMSLDKIKQILIKCIEILVELKSQINRLVGFFNAIVTLVEHAVQNQVNPFIENLKATRLSAEYSAAEPQQAEKILAKRRQDLINYNKNAVDGVNEVVNNSQAEITNNLEANAKAAAKDMGFIPVAQPPIVQRAIAQPNEQSKEIAAKAIQQTGTYIRRKLGNTSDLD